MCLATDFVGALSRITWRSWGVSSRHGTSPITGSTYRLQYRVCSSRCRIDHCFARGDAEPG